MTDSLTAAPEIPTVTLNDGTTIPQLGFGTFKVAPEDAEATVTTALEVGYRHIDTAQAYRNEAGVGAALAQSGIPREELYITTKLWNSNHDRDDVLRSFDESMDKLGLEVLDLFLIHWPVPMHYDGDLVSCWKAMGELRESGRVRSIGVSNFEPEHLEAIIDATGVVPVVNQVEVHPYFTNERVRAASRSAAIAVEAWSPLGQGGELLDEQVLAEIAAELHLTPAQVVLRWHIERGDIIFPKSSSKARMEENIRIFDAAFTPEHTARIATLDRGLTGRIGPDPQVFDAR